jgi:uncharacterized OB-fold protein
MTTAKRVPVVDGLFTETKEGARLLGSRCASCGIPYFPRSSLCHSPDCKDKTKLEDATFGGRGKVFSYTILRYPPPPPAKYDEPYNPYAIAQVDLEEGLRIMGRIYTNDVESVRVGMDVELILAPLCHDEQGNEVITWQFRLI